MTLGERIKQLRLEHKLSQEKLSELIGVSGQAVTKWEKGLSDPTTENLFKMAEIFGTTVDLMIGKSVGESKPVKLDEDEAYEIYKAVRRKHSKELLKRLKMFFGVLGIYVVFFIICKLFFLDLSQMSVSAILSPAYAGEKSDFNYLIGWLWGNNLYWYASLISALPALFDSPKCSVISTVGFALGIIFGEIFGKNPPGEPYGFGHYGWAIWGAILGISIIMGVVFQAKHIKLRSKQGKIWLGVFAALILTVVFFIRLSMPTEFGA